MLQLSGAGKRYGHKLLFEGADWMITPRDRVGLVGANGTGKSTLLKILAGTESLDYGSVSRAKGISAGYLPQDGLALSGRTVFAECMSVFSHLRKMEKEMEELTGRMSELDHSSPEYTQVAERYQRIEHEFTTRDGYAIEAQVGTVLGGLGFRKEDWTRQTEEFSGGWQMRIALVKLLLQQPNILLLDEPTNHLDLEARNWLEEYLNNYPYAFVLISHDRYFLDVTINKIVEIWNKRIHLYHGNYAKYLNAKTERLEQLEAAYRNQRDRIEQLEVFINRFRYQATKAKQVQSRIKELEKIERIEIAGGRKDDSLLLPATQARGPDRRRVRRSREIVRRERSISRRQFPDRTRRSNRSGRRKRGRKIDVDQAAGAEPNLLTEGEYKLGHNVDPDYFAQDQYKELDPDARILDDLGEVSPRSTQTELRSLLGCFLFSADDVFKRIGVLSGGERNRYALLRMLLHPANFLLLDEPTNHLDMRAKDVLLKALTDYNGTVVFVSHDRYFIDKLATRVLEVGDGRVEVYPGNYEDYRWRKEGGAAELQKAVSSPANSQPSNGNANGQPAKSEDSAAKRLNPIKRKQMEDRVHELESEINRLEDAIAECEAALQSFVSAEETQRVTQELDLRRWTVAGEALRNGKS